MARKKYTTAVKFSPEYVRRAKSGGLELVKVTNGKETVKPVQITTSVKGRNRLMVGIEARPVFVTTSGRTTVIDVS